MGMSVNEEKRFNGVPRAKKASEGPRRVHVWPSTMAQQCRNPAMKT